MHQICITKLFSIISGWNKNDSVSEYAFMSFNFWKMKIKKIMRFILLMVLKSDANAYFHPFLKLFPFLVFFPSKIYFFLLAFINILNNFQNFLKRVLLNLMNNFSNEMQKSWKYYFIFKIFLMKSLHFNNISHTSEIFLM